MTPKEISPAHNLRAASMSLRKRATAKAALATDFKPSSDEVAKRAYLNYISQGSLHGCDVQHWLQAESQLFAERKLAGIQSQMKDPVRSVTAKARHF